MPHEFASRQSDPENGEEARSILNELLSDLPGVVYRCRNDRDWTLLAVTRSVEKLTGYSPDSFLDDDPLCFGDIIHGDDRDRVWEEVQSAIQRERTFRLVYRIVTRRGEERWVLEQGQAKAADPDDPSATVLTGYIQDISGPLGKRLTDQVQELSAARDEQRTLGLLHRISSIANDSTSLDAALEEALPVVCGLLGYEVGHAWLLDEDSEEGIRASSIWHLADDPELERFRKLTEAEGWSRSEGAPGRVIRSLAPEWISDVHADPSFLRVAPDDPVPVRSGVVFPVVSGSAAVAVLEFYTTNARQRALQHLDLVEQVGIQLGRVAEREAAIRTRLQAEDRMRQFAENADAAFVLSTLEGEVLYLSSGFERLAGREGPVRESSELAEILHPDDRDWVLELFTKPDRAPYDIQYRVIRQEDGQTRWIRQKAFPIQDEDGQTYRVGAWAQDVTEERERRKRVERTTRLLEQTISSLEEAVLIIDSSREEHEIVEVNEAATRIFGYEKDELIGSDTERLHLDREHYERFGELGAPALAATGIFRASFPLRRKDGTVFEAEQTVRLLDPEKGLDGGVVSVVRDISRREEAERGRQASEQRFQEIAERIRDVFWVSRPEKDSIEYLSPAFKEIWGLDPEVVYEDSTAWLDTIHPDDRGRVTQLLPLQSQPDETYDVEYRIIQPDGAIRWIWDRSFPVTDEEGKVVRVVGVAEDVTDRKELERQLAQSQKMEAVGRLAGGIAHDFNNILTIIRSQTDLFIVDHEPDEKARQELEVVRDAADRAATLTKQLLAFSRDQIMRPRIIDLNDVIRRMRELLARTLGEDVRLSVDLDEATPPIEVDPSQLEQVILNLAVNAREAMPRGGELVLRTGSEEIGDEAAMSIPGLQAGDYAFIEVRDTGTGIELPVLDRIFEPFFTTRREKGGTGLGLAVTYGIVKQSGGHIQVKSRVGVGTSFTIRLPPSTEEPEEPTPEKEATGSSRPLTGAILVVEDDPSVGRVTRRILERAGFEVEMVDNGQAAVDLLDRDGGRFDLVLTDLVLPGKSGREIAHQVIEGDLELAIAVMSGYDSPDQGERESLPDQVFFIQKPFTPTGLLELVGKALEPLEVADDEG